MARFELSDILKLARDPNTQASDIHFKVGNPIYVRVQGILGPVQGLENLTEEDNNDVLNCLLKEDQIAKFKDNGNLDCSFEERIGDKRNRYRVNVAQDLNGPYITIRLIPDKIKEINDIGFPNNIYQELSDLNSGLVLVTGVTGSGKSTTLASIIQEINRNREDHIISLEDPIEYVHRRVKSIISQREIGTHLKSFGEGVKYSLRQDPDVILVGEIRDAETAEKALEAAATGHLVLSTLHTNSAAETVRRYVNLFPPSDHDNIRNSLASNLSFVLTQQLIPYQKGLGRTLAMEVMNVRDSVAIQSRLRKGEYFQIENELQTGSKHHMISMDQHLELLYNEGKIKRDAAIFYSRNRDAMRTKLK